MTGRLEGKVAVVTGAGSGMGRVIAAAFHREGAMVAVTDRSGEEQATAKTLGPGAFPVRADIARRDEVESLVASTVEAFGGLHVVCNCAAVPGKPALTGDCTDENWDHVMNVNLRGTFLVIRACLPYLVGTGGGSIINISSAQATVAFPMTPAYAASKGGLVTLTRVIAAEYAKAGVRANVITPGLVDTPMMRGFEAVASPGALDGVIAMTPMARLGRPEEVAAMALFLASDESSYVTGATLPVDGGYTAM